MPHVLFLAQGASDRLPSRRLRVSSLTPFFEDLDYEILVAPTTFLTAIRVLGSVFISDIIFIQKELMPIWLLVVFRLLGKKIIYDFDDAVYLRHLSSGTFRLSQKRSSRFSRVCRYAHVVIAGNEILAARAYKSGAKVVRVIPTGVYLPSDVLKPMDEIASGRSIVLGWIGTKINLVYLEAWENILIQLQDDGYQFELWVMSSKPPSFIKFKNFRFLEWSESAQVRFLSEIDIGLMPLDDNEYTVGKCGYKALQYMSHFKPIVASDVGINRDWFGGAGYVSNHEKDIFHGLVALITSKIERDQMGLRGREIIEKKFQMALVAQKVKQVIDELS